MPENKIPIDYSDTVQDPIVAEFVAYAEEPYRAGIERADAIGDVAVGAEMREALVNKSIKARQDAEQYKQTGLLMLVNQGTLDEGAHDTNLQGSYDGKAVDGISHKEIQRSIRSSKKLVEAVSKGISPIDGEPDQRTLEAQTYAELYADTPAKKILWDMRQEIEQEPNEFARMTALISVLEAYSVIDEAEGLSVLDEIMHSLKDRQFVKTSDGDDVFGWAVKWAKVEALTRYGILTERDALLEAARTEMKGLWGYSKNEQKAFMALETGLPKYIDIAMKDRENNSIDLKLAFSLNGYLPPYQQAQEMILAFSRDESIVQYRELSSIHELEDLIATAIIIGENNGFLEVDSELNREWNTLVKHYSDGVKHKLSNAKRLLKKLPTSFDYSVQKQCMFMLKEQKDLIEQANKAREQAIKEYEREQHEENLLAA